MKSSTTILLCVFFATTYQLKAQEPFPYLQVLNLAPTPCSENTAKIPIHYDQSLGTEVNLKLEELPTEHPLYTNEMGSHDILALKLRFRNGPPNEYYLVYSMEPSCDPRFLLYDVKTNKYIARTSGLEIYIPGNNTLYTTGHTNSMFNIRKKYTYNDTLFQELTPEFYYVGLSTKTLSPLSIFADELLTNKLAQLPSDYEIEVLVAKRTHDHELFSWKYLIRTSLGLVGWATIEDSSQVKGIFFNGD